MPQWFLLAVGLFGLALAGAGCSDEKPKDGSAGEKSSGGDNIVSRVRTDADTADRTLQQKTKGAGDWLDDKSQDVSKPARKAGDEVEGVFDSDHKPDKPAPKPNP